MARTVPPKESNLEKFRRSQTKAKSWLWLGVIGMAAIIFFFWGWSIVSNISLFNWKNTQENTLLKKTQNDWNQIFTETTEKQEKKKLSEQLNVVINELKKQAEAEQSTTTTTTVPTTTTSTTIENTTITTTIKQ